MSGRNEPCECGSGTKFKKCCGARGRITVMSVAEDMAYCEARVREPRKKSKSTGAFLSFATFAASVDMASMGRSKSNRRRR
jgi:hypothetical protein